MIEYSNFPAYIHLTDAYERADYDVDLMIKRLRQGMALWDDSVEQKSVFRSLRKMILSTAVQVTNIVCIGHGSLGQSPDSTMQHVAAISIAEELSRLYEEVGKPVQHSNHYTCAKSVLRRK